MSARLRGLLALGLCLCLALALLPAEALAVDTAPTTNWSDQANYDDTWYNDADAVFTLTTPAQMAGLTVLAAGLDGKTFAGKTIKLDADLDMSAHLWSGVENFSGTFLGQGHVISGVVTKELLTGGSGFFKFLKTGAKVDGLIIQDAVIESTGASYGSTGLLATGSDTGVTISNCMASGRMSLGSRSGADSFVGGLVGTNGGTVKNSVAYVSAVTGDLAAALIAGVAGGAGSTAGTVENCFGTVESVNLTNNTSMKKYAIAPRASYSYWPDSSVLDNSGPDPNLTQSYPVTPAQIAGTSGDIIGQATDTYANTASLMEAMNAWVTAENAKGDDQYITWGVNKFGEVVPATLLPTYIDIGGPLNDVTHQSATGDIETGMDLDGQVQQSVSLLSVTLPSSIPFIVDVEANGAFKRVLSATGNLTNRSDTGVNITLTAVTDDGGLLDKVDLSLVPAPPPASGNVALSAGTGKTDLLAALAAPAAGVPATATVKVDGAAKSGVASVGADGAQFTVGLTLKVSKQ